MTEADRKQLIQEIKRYARSKNYNSSGKITSPELKLTGEAEYMLRYSENAKKLLINNEFGLLGNLLYKYIRDGEIDETVHKTMRMCDERVVRDAYRKYKLALVREGRLSDNRTAMGIIISIDKDAVQYINYPLNESEDFLCEAAKYSSLVMQKASPKLLKNRDFVYRMVQMDPKCLEYADYKVKQDREIALEACSHYGMAVQWIDFQLRRDDEIILAAVTNDGRALSYAMGEHLKNPVYVETALKTCGHAIQYADAIFRKDFDMSLKAVKKDGTMLHYLDDSMKKNRDIVIAAVSRMGSALQFAAEEFRDDEEIVRIAVREDMFAFRHASLRIQEIYRQAIINV